MAIIGFIFLFLILGWLTLVLLGATWWQANGDTAQTLPWWYLCFLYVSLVCGWYLLLKNAPFVIVATN